MILLVGQQAMHPVTCNKLCPLTIQCFDAVGWVRGRASWLLKTHFCIHYYQGATS